MKLKPAFLFALLMITTAFQGLSAEFCEDKEITEKWDMLGQQFKEDYRLQLLHAFYIGLCEKTKRGDLSSDEAMHFFSKMKQTFFDSPAPTMKQESSSNGPIKPQTLVIAQQAHSVDAPHGKTLRNWDKGERFTSNARRDGFYKITGDFIDGKWVQNHTSEWISEKFVKAFR